MEGTHCGGEGGWTRVIYINVTQAGTTCPSRTRTNVLYVHLYHLVWAYQSKKCDCKSHTVTVTLDSALCVLYCP